MPRLNLNAVILVILSLLLLGCGRETRVTYEIPHVAKYLVHGDPILVTAGSTLDQKSIFTKENYQLFTSFQIISDTTFASKSQLVFVERGSENSEENIEAGQEAVTDDEVPEIETVAFTFTRHQGIDGESYRYHSLDNRVAIIFHGDRYHHTSSVDENGVITTVMETTKAKELKLVALEVEGEQVDVQALHYSINSDEDHFSILISGQYKGTKFIRSLGFIKIDSRAKLTEDVEQEEYNFLYGQKRRVVFPSGTQVSACTDKKYSGKMVEDKFKEWEQALKRSVPGNYFSFKVLKKYPPFSDVNVHCVYFVPTYVLSMPDSESASPGATVAVSHISSRTILDSDIFIWGGEFEKMARIMTEDLERYGLEDYDITHDLERELNQTILHEMGHLFGLHHKFVDGVYSVMAYNYPEKSTFLRSYDAEAIFTLYRQPDKLDEKNDKKIDMEIEEKSSLE